MRLNNTCKTQGELDAMRAAGRVVALTLRAMQQAIEGGERSTLALEQIAEDTLAEHGAFSAFKGYQPPFHSEAYAWNTCISVNHEIVHGMPSADKVLNEGDIVGLDLGAAIDGWYADSAITVPVGKIEPVAYNLLLTTQQALKEGIKAAHAGRYTGDIGAAIGEVLRKRKYRAAQDLCGHGIGRTPHELPSVPNEGRKGTGTQLNVGMTICIEPMVNVGTHKVLGGIPGVGDGWTIYTADKSLSAHFEHTVAITDNGPVILTRLDD